MTGRMARGRALVRRSVGAAIVATLLCSCGTSVAGGTGGEPRQFDPDLTVQLLNQFYTQVYGDAAVRQAIRVVAWSEHDAQMTDCMRREGTAYQPDSYLDLGYPGIADMALPLPPTADSAVEAYALNEATWWSTRPWPNAVRDAGEGEQKVSKEQESARQTCDELNEPSNPGGWPDLANQLYGALLAAIQQSVNTEAVQSEVRAYPTCMRSQGYDVESRDQLRMAFGDEYTRLFNGGQDPRTGTEWRTLVQEEVQAARADAACRRHMFELTMASLAPLLEQFQNDRGSHLHTLAVVYEDLIQQAKQSAAASNLEVSWYRPGEVQQPLKD